MALGLSNALQFQFQFLPKYIYYNNNNNKTNNNNNIKNIFFPKITLHSSPLTSNSLLILSRTSLRVNRLVCAASSAAGSSSPDSDASPYQILGVSPIEGFDAIKSAYNRKRKDAERRGDETTLSQIEKAYDKIMMAQLTNRKKGVTFGSFQVSKDIKYADKMPIIPWGPRFTKSSVNDSRINLAIAVVFTAWILITRNADWKPLQFLSFVFVYRIFEKLKAFEPATSPTVSEYGEEDEGRGLRMGKRLLRSLALVFGSIAAVSLGFTGLLNLLEMGIGYIPAVLFSNQELFVTASTALTLYILATYYR